MIDSAQHRGKSELWYLVVEVEEDAEASMSKDGMYRVQGECDSMKDVFQLQQVALMYSLRERW